MQSFVFIAVLVILTCGSAFCASHTFFGNCTMATFDVVKMSLEYTEKNKTYPKELTIPKDVKVSSVCTGSTSHSLTLEFDDSKLVFTFKANDATDVQLTLAYTFTPSRLFPNKSKDAITVSQTHPLDLKINSTENKSYLCKADQSLELTAKPANLTVAFKNMQLQAYQLKNQTFGDAEECPQDHPTTTSSSTTQSTTVPSTMPPTIPPTMPPMPDIPTVYNYTVHESNKSELICLYLEAAMELKITYETVNNKNATQLIILGEADSNGQCSNSAETLTLSYSTANITMTFTLALNDKTVDLRHVALNYTLTPSVFPDVKNPEEIQIETNFKEKIWQYPQSDYFTCTANQSINFNGSQAILFTTKLKVKAFNNNDKPDVTGKAYTQCEADTSTSAIVPIAVGAALAALVVIVLVAYLIGRRRSNRGYESV